MDNRKHLCRSGGAAIRYPGPLKDPVSQSSSFICLAAGWSVGHLFNIAKLPSLVWSELCVPIVVSLLWRLSKIVWTRGLAQGQGHPTLQSPNSVWFSTKAGLGSLLAFSRPSRPLGPAVPSAFPWLTRTCPQGAFLTVSCVKCDGGYVFFLSPYNKLQKHNKVFIGEMIECLWYGLKYLRKKTRGREWRKEGWQRLCWSWAMGIQGFAVCFFVLLDTFNIFHKMQTNLPWPPSSSGLGVFPRDSFTTLLSESPGSWIVPTVRPRAPSRRRPPRYSCVCPRAWHKTSKCRKMAWEQMIHWIEYAFCSECLFYVLKPPPPRSLFSGPSQSNFRSW